MAGNPHNLAKPLQINSVERGEGKEGDEALIIASCCMKMGAQKVSQGSTVIS